MNNEVTCLALTRVTDYGSKRVNSLVQKIDLSAIPNLSELVAAIQEANLGIKVPTLDEMVSCFDYAMAIRESLTGTDIGMTTILSEDYPERLKADVPNPPPVLFYKGDLANITPEAVAIVGTRNPTSGSFEVAEKLTDEMAGRGYCIVSGLAKGIDTVAHRTAIENGAVTVAVLAHGLNTIYPKENADLAVSILENKGVLLSEYVPDEKIAPYQFVARDRIQSALSKAVFAVQSTKDGGTMKTAGFAIKQKRELYVYSSGVDSLDFGGNQELISQGVKTFTKDVKAIVLEDKKEEPKEAIQTNLESFQ